MEEVFKQIAVIKEEYASECKEYQAETKHTARMRDQIASKESELDTMVETLAEDTRLLIMLKIDIGDQECKKRAAQGRLEIVLEEKRAALKELDTALAIEADLVHQAQEMKSPEDYKKALLKQRQSMDSLRQEVAAETNIGRQLSSRLSTLTDAQSRFARLKEDIETLKKMKQGLFTELAQLERTEAQNKSRTSGSVPELQHQLQEAQRRYAYLCTYQQALQ